MEVYLFCFTNEVLQSNEEHILIRFPLYYHVKFAFLVWLQLPSTNVSFYIAFLGVYSLLLVSKIDLFSFYENYSSALKIAHSRFDKGFSSIISYYN